MNCLSVEIKIRIRLVNNNAGPIERTRARYLGGIFYKFPAQGSGAPFT